MRRKSKYLEKTFTRDTSDKRLLSKMYKEFLKLNIKKTSQLKNGPRILMNTSPKKIFRWQVSISKDAPCIKWSKNSLFNKCCWEIWTVTCKKMKLNDQLTPYTKINSRWIKDLNISRHTIKVLEKNIGSEISDIPHSNILTDMSPKARDIKERINKWDLIKIKSFCMAKEEH